MNIKSYLIGIAFLVLLPSACFACTCGSAVVKDGSKTSTDELRQYYLRKFNGALFVGEVTKIEKAEAKGDSTTIPGLRVTMKVERFWRGVASSEVNIFTYYGSGSCGVSYVEGEKYFVFARNLKWGLTTDSCTSLNKKEASKFMEFLGEGWYFPSTAKPNNSLNRSGTSLPLIVNLNAIRSYLPPG